MRNFLAKRSHWLFVSPAVLLLLALTVYPFARAVWLSLFRYNLARPWVDRPFLGLGNFADFFSDTFLGKALWVTLKFGVATVGIEVVVGFGVAWMLNQKLRGSSFFRIIYLLPMMIVPVVAGLTWQLMLNDSYGVINWMFDQVGLPGQVWTGTQWAMLTVVVVQSWQWLPFSILIFTVALGSIPREYYEAAAVDGASRWHTFRYITIPNMRWALAIVAIFSLSDAIKAFDVIFALTGGGPGITTQTLALYIHRTGFTHWEMGYASALSLLILFISMVILFPIIRRMEKLD